MQEEEVYSNNRKQSIILENRRKLMLSGVKDVSGFDEQCIYMDSVLGKITVKGSELRISNFSVETGELDMEGIVDSISYSESTNTETGFFKRLFR